MYYFWIVCDVWHFNTMETPEDILQEDTLIETELIDLVEASQEESDANDEQSKSALAPYTTIIMKKVLKGKMQGRVVKHYSCNFCSKILQGPSTGTMLSHLRTKHSSSCPNLTKKETDKNINNKRGFFLILLRRSRSSMTTFLWGNS
jgi:hypothetical protein